MRVRAQQSPKLLEAFTNSFREPERSAQTMAAPPRSAVAAAAAAAAVAAACFWHGLLVL